MLKLLSKLLIPKMAIPPPSVSLPLIVVAGCTGTGKSDLGIEIALKYNGEIISADSMQLYKGLDIVTNKVTEEEAKGIPHHLMSFLQPSQEYNVHSFQQDSLRIIREIRKRGRLPIVVGGTAYYIEGLMYKDSLIKINQDEGKLAEIRHQIDKMSPEEIFEELKKNDPTAARLVHPNNKYRVRRALEIFKLTGEKKSDLLQPQKSLRFPNTLLFILDAKTEVLDERLDKRVEKMKQRGVLEELDSYYSEHRDAFGSHGVKQSIGLKEFEDYLKLDPDIRTAKKGERMLAHSFDQLQLHTRQYSRMQRRWFIQRFLRRGKLREVPNTMVLNTSTSFFDGVVPFALDRVGEFLQTGSLAVVEGPFVFSNKFSDIEDPDYVNNSNRMHHCSTCGITIQSTEAYEIHLKGRKHMKATMAEKKRRKREQKMNTETVEDSNADCAEETAADRERPVASASTSQ